MEIKQLKDRSWTILTYNTEDGHRITNATFRVLKVNYDVIQQTVLVEVEFKENTFPIVRSFLYSLPKDSAEEISAENIKLFIETLFPTADEIL